MVMERQPYHSVTLWSMQNQVGPNMSLLNLMYLIKLDPRGVQCMVDHAINANSIMLLIYCCISACIHLQNRSNLYIYIC